jgi:hypothetical protein
MKHIVYYQIHKKEKNLMLEVMIMMIWVILVVWEEWGAMVVLTLHKFSKCSSEEEVEVILLEDTDTEVVEVVEVDNNSTKTSEEWEEEIKISPLDFDENVIHDK